jgi:hypothetical protein
MIDLQKKEAAANLNSYRNFLKIKSKLKFSILVCNIDIDFGNI